MRADAARRDEPARPPRARPRPITNSSLRGLLPAVERAASGRRASPRGVRARPAGRRRLDRRRAASRNGAAGDAARASAGKRRKRAGSAHGASIRTSGARHAIRHQLTFPAGQLCTLDAALVRSAASAPGRECGGPRTRPHGHPRAARARRGARRRYAAAQPRHARARSARSRCSSADDVRAARRARAQGAARRGRALPIEERGRYLRRAVRVLLAAAGRVRRGDRARDGQARGRGARRRAARRLRRAAFYAKRAKRILADRSVPRAPA